MAGPWEKYAAPVEAAPADVPPWAKYAAPALTPPIDAVQIVETINRQFAPDAVAGRQDDDSALHRFATRGALAAGNTGIQQGMTLGFGDELMAGALSPIEALKGAITGEDADKGFGQRMADAYGRALDRERGTLHQAETDHPIATGAGNLAGGLMLGGKAQEAGLTLLKGAPSIWKGAAEGAGYGALQGFGSGEGGVQKRLDSALTGAEIGGGGGAAIGAASKAIPAIANYITAFRDPEIGSLSKPALDYARRNISPDVLQSAQELGPLGTLADVSPEWLGVARGAASVPDSRGAVVDALLQRGSGANARLANDLNASLGQVVEPSAINRTVDQGLATTRQQYGPLFQNARAVNTEPLAASLETNAVNLRGPAQQSTQRVRNMLDITGAPGQLDPSPNTLFQTRQAIDGMISTEADPKAVAALTQARNQVDAELQRAVPGIKDPDAQFQQLMQQREALEQGNKILDSGKTTIRPVDLQSQITEMAQPNGTLIGPSAAPLRLQQGVRAEIDRTLGTKANDPVAFSQLMKGEGDWNRQKLGLLFGRDNADAALAAGDREALFNTVKNRVENGSDTGMTQGFREAMKAIEKPADLPPNVTTLGVASWAAKKGLDKVLSRNGEKAAADFASQLGRLSVAQGDARDRIVNALINYQAGKTNPQLSPGVRAVVNALIQQSGMEGRAIGPAWSQ